MNDKLLKAAKDLVNSIADHNGNIFSEYSAVLPYNGKIKLNRLVKALFKEIKDIENASQSARNNP